MSRSALEPGALLAGRYRIDAPIGEGGMGVVFRAHDTLLDRPVALKALSPHLFSPEGLKRLLREAQAAARLTHPGIVATYDVIQDGDARFIVMEFVAGRTLRDMIPLPWQDVIRIASQVCEALQYAHAQGVIHRDIKPENIIVTGNGFAKLMDFGLARSEGRSRLTQTGMIVGTVAYMAPEQAIGGLVDARSDLYSLGAVLYEAITGKPPFAADDPIAVISMHVNVPPVSPRFYTPEIPTTLESIIMRLLAKDPTARYESADEVSRFLQTVLIPLKAGEEAGEIIAATPSTSLLDLMTRGRLVDREEELAALKTALESMLSGRGQVVFLAGEPGIGKTRLAEELLVYARLRGCLAVGGRCYEQDVNIPYLGFAEAVRALIHAIPADSFASLVTPQAPELVKLVPELTERIPNLVPSAPLDPDQERLRLYHTVSRFVIAAAKIRPIVLTLDDLHWADAGTLQLLRHLARAIRDERVLVVGSYRDVEVDRAHPLSSALSEMNRERLYRRILVRGLAPADVAAMIQTIFQAKQAVSDELRDLIHQETEGNPFFVEEVLKHLVEVGTLYIEDGRWQHKPIAELDIPQSVREVLGRRLERVSEPCQRTLSLAAVIGRRFRFDVLQTVGELPEEDLLNTLEEAIRTQLIREVSNGEDEYDFAHTLIRDVLYEGLSLRRRRLFHQKIGGALEQRYAGRIEAVVEDLAHHYTRAPQGAGLERAIRYSLEAAEKAMRLFAYEEAIKFYRNAIELLDEAGDERRIAQVRLAVGEPFTYLAKIPSALETYKQALQFYERQGSPREKARVHLLTGRALDYRADFLEAIPHLEQALRDLSPEEDAADRVEAHLGMARAMVFTGRLEEGEDHAKQALNLARIIGDLSMQADALTTLGVVSDDQQDPDAALGHYAEAKRLAEQAGGRRAIRPLWRIRNNIAVIHEQRGNFDEALRLYLKTKEAAKSVKWIGGIAYANLNLFGYHFWHGEWEAARQHVVENLQLDLQPLAREACDYLLHWLSGEWDVAATIALNRLDIARQRGGLSQIFAWNAELAMFNLELGRVQEAKAAAAEAATMAEHGHQLMIFPSMVFVFEALARGGDLERCDTLCAKGEALSRRYGSPTGLAAALGGRAALSLERGQADEALRLLDEAMPLVERLRVLYAHLLRMRARAFLRRGESGDDQRAKQALRQCLELLERMGDRRKSASVRAELAALA